MTEQDPHTEEEQPDQGEEHQPSRVDQELLAEHQGAESPQGDLVPPLPVERHGRRWVIHDPRVERDDTDLETDVPD